MHWANSRAAAAGAAGAAFQFGLSKYLRYAPRLGMTYGIEVYKNSGYIAQATNELPSVR